MPNPEHEPTHALDPKPGPPEPLPAATRLLTIWDGDDWIEIDIRARRVIDTGRRITHEEQHA